MTVRFTPDDMAQTVLAASRFIKGCGSLPAFDADFTLLHWIVLSTLSKEGHALGLRSLRRHIGLSSGRAQRLCQAMQEVGWVRLTDEGAALTADGLQKLADTEHTLAPYIDNAIGDHAYMASALKKIRLISRIWSRPLHQPARPADA